MTMSTKYVIDNDLIINFVVPPGYSHIEVFDSQIRGFY